MNFKFPDSSTEFPVPTPVSGFQTACRGKKEMEGWGERKEKGVVCTQQMKIRERKGRGREESEKMLKF